MQSQTDTPKTLKAWAKALQIAMPWTWKATADGGAVITSQPRGYEPRDFTFSADELRDGPR